MAHMTVAELIAQAVAEQQLTLAQATDRLGVTKQTRINWMRGQRPTDPEHIDAIAEFCGVSVVDVLVAAGYLTEDDARAYATSAGMTGSDSSWFLPSFDLTAA